MSDRSLNVGNDGKIENSPQARWTKDGHIQSNEETPWSCCEKEKEKIKKRQKK